MILGIDIDGTIKDTHRAAVEVFNREYNKSYQPDEVTEYYLHEFYGLTSREGAQAWRRLEEEIYQLGVPLPHAPEVLSDLVNKGHQIYFITARPGFPNIRKVTKEWLKTHGFPFNGDNLIMNAQNKAKHALKLGVQLFFEDAPVHLDNLVHAGVNTVIVDAVYNRSYPHPLPRITDWRQVYDLIDQA
jgi:uncharacterized HAD superfamily protein